MPHVVFYLPSGQVVAHTECQEGMEEYASNPATNLSIKPKTVPDTPLTQWRVTEDGTLITTNDGPEYPPEVI